MNKPSLTSLLALTAIILVSCGCRLPVENDPLADSGRTQRTESLLQNLKALGDSAVYMFGHHDDTMYGIGWQNNDAGDSAVHQRSDAESVCGDFPALLSFDLGHLELGHDKNLDGVPFDRMRKEIVAHDECGGMTTLSWHLDNPLSGGSSWVADSLKEVESGTVAAILEGGVKHERFLSWLDRVADFLNSLVTPEGVRIPVIFRPWHEHTGSWFWWGQAHCTAEQYKALWQMTVSRLKEKGVVNALYAYSPGSEPDGNPEKYLERYPGDDVIDLMGLDCYCFAPDADTMRVAAYAAQLDKNLGMACRIAREHGKAVALTETGYEGIKTTDWWTHTLAPVLARHPISYVLVWRNAHDKPGHFFAPYPGHPSAADFVQFYNDSKTLFLRDVKRQ
ncbi:MAG: beta-mannosidase [Prevotella sp.]|jgi:mannan endo-1,4-beta-mannosidase|nr:beta-mannosidase [Prevotella sp.]